jgi:hypothetical protein
MAYNLARNSRVFVTTNVNTATGAVITTGLTTANTFEVQVLDGFKFSQATNTTNIQINEAGTTPIRGQRAFNTALNPVDITFSTYIRPRLATNQATAEERVLWNALLGSVAIGDTGVTVGGTGHALSRTTTATPTATLTGTSMATTLTVGKIYNISGLTGTAAPKEANAPAKIVSNTASAIVFEYLTAPAVGLGTGFTGVTASASVKFTEAAWVEYPTATGITTSYGQVTSAVSGRNQLQTLGFIFVVDGSTYTIDNCALDQAQIDFGLDAIAMINWTAKGTKLNQLATNAALSTDQDPVFSGGLTGTATGKITTANYITNKLSTVTLVSKNSGTDGTAYSVVLTGGNITIANNINYITPNNIGTLNVPIGYYTGARSISGSMNAYLRTGTFENKPQTATLLKDLLTASATATDTKYALGFQIGGSTAPTRVELDMPGAMIGIPSVDIADVVATTITFNAQGTDTANTTGTFDIENTNDLTARYYSA